MLQLSRFNNKKTVKFNQHSFTIWKRRIYLNRTGCVESTGSPIIGGAGGNNKEHQKKKKQLILTYVQSVSPFSENNTFTVSPFRDALQVKDKPSL